MNIYQGGPINATIKVKDKNQQGQEVWVSDLSGYTMEALMRNRIGDIVAKWSTAKGTITSHQVTEQGATVGYLAFFMSGNQTATLPEGIYTIEIAKVLDSNGNNITTSVNRAIASAFDVINIIYSAIRGGVDD